MKEIMNSIFSRRALLSLLLVAGAWLPHIAFAQASLFVTPPSGSYKAGELFSVLVNVNSGGKSINVASARISFDTGRLEVRDLGYSRSIFTIWTEEPSFSNSSGIIRFSGGLPSPGYNGSSGAIVRVTFRTKASGRAPVTFVSGSVLANNGEGTNIAEALTGAEYTIIPSGTETTAPVVSPSVTSPDFEHSKQTVDAPLIVEWPRQIEEGELLTIRGLGFPNSKILLYFQKGDAEPVVKEVYAGADGKFSYTYDEKVLPGYYRIWARTVGSDGAISDYSDQVTVEVIKTLFLRIGSIALNYASVTVTLFALLVLAVIIISLLWTRWRRRQVLQGKEISEAEHALHDSFDTLKKGLDRYASYLRGGKTPKGIKRREARVRETVRKDLEEMEKSIEKEIDDIGKK